MGNWSTLNKGVTTSTKDVVEIQVDRLLEKYQETLKYHQVGQLDVAKEKYEQLVSNALVKKEPKPKKQTNTNQVEESPLSTLRFLVFKNYASLLEQEFSSSPEDPSIAKNALDYYLQAVKIDPTEYTIWYHIGHLSHQLKKLRFARMAYETGFFVKSNERVMELHALKPSDVNTIITTRQYTPMQWKCLEGLCSVLYDIGEYNNCKTYVNLIMKHVKHWDLGSDLLQKIEKNEHYNTEDMDIVVDDVDVPEFIPVVLEKSDWSVLLKALMKEYKRIVVNNVENEKSDQEKNLNLSCRLTDTSFVNQRIRISVKSVEEERRMDVDDVEEHQIVEERVIEKEHIESTVPEITMEPFPNRENTIDEPAIVDDRQAISHISPETVTEEHMEVDLQPASIDLPKAHFTENNPIGNEYVENQSVENQSIKNQPTESQPTEGQPIESRPAESQPAESPFINQSTDQPTEDQPTENQPTENQLTEVNYIVIPDDENDHTQSNDTTINPSHKRKREDEPLEIDAQNDKEVENNSENDGNSEGDEEDEAEEKRLSLRASKRQREKIANEETSRLKMLEEEKEFTRKVQAFYDISKNIPHLYRPTPWYTSKNNTEDSTPKFWEWFDHKISELDGQYCWDIDTTLMNTSSLFGDSKGKGLTLFSKSEKIVQEKSSSSNAIVKDFVNELNRNNSGITDSLCRLIQAFVHNDIINEQDSGDAIMENELLESITDTITALEITFVNKLLFDKINTDVETIAIILRISEYFIDRVIRGSVANAEETSIHSTLGGRRKVSTSLGKSSKVKVVEGLTEQCQFWMNLLERAMFSSSLTSFFSEINETEMSNCIPLEKYKMQMRYWVLKGKFSQCADDIEGAYSYYSKCRDLLQETIEQFEPPVVIRLNSLYDNIIDLTSIESKLGLLQAGKLFIVSKQKLETEDYEGVIADLEPTVKSKLTSQKVSETNEVIQTIEILATAYVKTNRHLDAWNCYLRMFCCVMQQFITYGESHTAEASYLSKNDDVQFFKLLGLISSVADSLVSLIQQDNSEDWLPTDINVDLADQLVVLLRMSIYYNFRHPDYIPFVNNFTNPELPIHRPSKVTRSSGFNSITIKAWVLQSHLFQHTILSSKLSDERHILINWANLLHDLHDDLGEREMCGAADCIYLKHLMKTLVKADDKLFRKEIYQCYHCIYGVHIAAESDIIEEHHCTHRKLSQESSEPLFALVVDSCVEKLEEGVLLKNDLRDVIEAISDLFEELPTKHSLIKSNEDVIEDYLDQSLRLHSTFDQVLRDSIIPTVNIDSKKTGISMVYFKIFWIRGKTLRIQNKNRAKVSGISSEKTKLDIKSATEDFTNHLVLNPDDAEGWCELGACYQQLVEEELNWSAFNIQNHKSLIGEYQKASCHAYVRGIYLANASKRKALAETDLFINFGNLLYSIAASPMNMEALKSTASKATLEKDGTISQVKAPIPSRISVYKLALIFFNRALAYKTPGKLIWRCYYMIGKCLAKIGRPPREVLDWYLQAIRRAKSEKGKRNQQFEPIYIFCSYLVKCLKRNTLEAKDILELLATEKALHATVVENDPNKENPYSGVIMEIANTDNTSLILQELQARTLHLPTETANAYNALFMRLLEIRGTDNRNWQHRAIYRLSVMYSQVYQDVEKAKDELMKLFNLRIVTKSFITIWKGALELPGKHFEYISKYTLLLIELARLSDDTQVLKHLYRKLRRAQNNLLNDKKVYHKAYTAYLEIIRAQLRNSHQAKVYMKMIKESKIDKSQFESLCSIPTLTSAQNDSPELYTMLQDLAELKRLTSGFVLIADAEEDGSDKAIRMCYAALVFGGDSNAEKRRTLESALPSNGEPIESKSRKDLRLVLLAQAKAFMHTIPPSK